MKIDLAVIGQGAVTPAGTGLPALLHGKPTPTLTAGLACPEQTWPVLRVDLKDSGLARWQAEPRLRRSSPVTLFLIEAAEQALAGVSPADRAQTGLIVAFSAGCLLYSRRFFEGILKGGQKTASPALFPETVFNSPGSHVAAVLKLNSAVYAVTGDETAWIAALKTASIWLQRGRVKQVLVLGAEEFDPLVIDAYESARWLRREGPGAGFMPSEGAAGLLVGPAAAGQGAAILSARDGFIYRNPKEAASAAEKLFGGIDASLPCHRTASRTWLARLEEQWTRGRSGVGEEPPYLGEAFTASAAWNTVRALARLPESGSPVALPVWGLNHQLGALELQRSAR